MKTYHIDFSYNLPEWGTFEIETEGDLTPDEVEEIALKEIKETYSDITDIKIDTMKEIVNNV